MKNLLFPFLVACLWLTACSEDFFETTIPIELPNQEPKITLNCLANEQEPFRLSLTESKGLLSEEYGFNPIRNATIELLADGTPVGSFSYHGREMVYEETYMPEPYTFIDSAYYSFVTPPQVGQALPPYFVAQPNVTYTLKVSAPNLESVETSMHLPAAVAIQDLSVYPDAIVEVQNIDYTQYFLPIDVTINDPNDGEEHYYSLQIEPYNLVDYDGSGVLDTIRMCNCFHSNEVVFPKSNESDPFDSSSPADQSYTYYYDETLFSNQLFKGETVTLRVYTDFYEGQELLRIKATLSTLNKETYNYLSSRTLQQNVGENPFAEPVSVYNNVTNGFGIFGGSSKYVKVVDF